MPNNYGIIVCDESRKPNAGSMGRDAKLTGGAAATWRRDVIKKGLPGAQTGPCSVRTACNGSFTGHVIILMHGNYHPSRTSGVLYLEDTPKKLTPATSKVVGYVKSLNPTHVYIYACGQGAPAVLTWYRGASAFNMTNVWSPCITASMGGANPEDIKAKFGL